MLLILSTFAYAADPLALNVTTTTLDNGLVVILEENHRTDTVSLFLHYGVGSRDERDGERGCAHLFEHLMFEGSKHVPGNAFDTWLTEAGGWNNAFTSNDETAYQMEFPSGALDLGLMIESDRAAFLGEALTAENLKNQQGVVLQERDSGYYEPHGRDWDAMVRLQFQGGHPYEVPVIGTVADIEGFTLESTRDFWERHYRPRNAVLVLVGNFETAVALEKIQAWFGEVPDKGPAAPRATPRPASPGPRDGLLYDAVEDRALYLSWGTVPAKHADEPALQVLGQILSGGRGTRLDEALYYGSNLTTDIGAGQWTLDLDGVFEVYAYTDGKKLKPIEKAVMKEIVAVRDAGVTEAEVARAKKSLRFGWLDGLEYPMGRAEQISWCYRTYGKADCLVDEWKKIEAVTPADVQRVAQTYLIPGGRVSLSVVPTDGKGALKGAMPVELP